MSFLFQIFSPNLLDCEVSFNAYLFTTCWVIYILEASQQVHIVHVQSLFRWYVFWGKYWSVDVSCANAHIHSLSTVSHDSKNKVQSSLVV